MSKRRASDNRQRQQATPPSVGSARIGDQLRAALVTLDETTQLVFVLREVHEVPIASIAEGIGLTNRDARTRLHRARLRMMEVTRPFLSS